MVEHLDVEAEAGVKVEGATFFIQSKSVALPPEI
jgi:hypothetical protein